MKTNKLFLVSILFFVLNIHQVSSQNNSHGVEKLQPQSNTLIENVLLGKNNYAVDPKKVIDNKEFTRRIKQIIASKSPNYIIKRQADLIIVKPQKSKTEFTYSKRMDMVIGYTYYIHMEYELVQKELIKLKIEFMEGTNNGSFTENPCVSVSIESENDLVKVDYGYQCD